PPQHWITGLERIEHGALRNRSCDLEFYVTTFKVCQSSQVGREHYSDHVSVCTSTESTPGKSRTMGFQLSPASADAYTCPPLVPKYTPHGSSESTAIASRSTFT